MNDAYFTQTIYENSEISPIKNTIGTFYTFTIKSYYAENQPKTSGTDQFFLRIMIKDSPVKQQKWLYSSKYISENEYEIRYQVKNTSS
jgi:hypothetical protein